jgi:hypothetical protein
MMCAPNRRIATALSLCLLLWGSAASADFITIAQPDAGYLSATTRLDFLDPDFDVLASLSDGTETATFDADLVALTVPTTWVTWGAPPDTESATPRVLWTQGLSSLAIDLSLPALTFGFEAQPNTASVFDITASFFSLGNLVGSITLPVDGFAGARLFAASTTTDAFDRIELSSAFDFAIANLRYGAVAVPEPGSTAILLLAGLVIARERRRAGRE